MFPAETVPDGSVAWPHHYALGLYLVALAALVALNDTRTTDPLAVLAGAGIGLFSWFHLWGTGYPVAGALASILGVVVVGLAVVRSVSLPVIGIQIGGFRSRYGRDHAIVVLVGLVVAFDDWVSHAFGIWTPLDWIWGVAIYPIMG